MDKHLHIIAPDVPWPVSHGGYFDLYYKLQALFEAGIKIHFHCFTTGRELPQEIKQLCFECYVYKRQTGIRSFSFQLPYIVKSRSSKLLEQRLLKDDFPVLCEGIHTTSLLLKPQFKNRNVNIRLHNIEHRYYYELFKIERNIFKKIYFLIEAVLLKAYERRISKNKKVFCVSSADAAYYKDHFLSDAIFLPVFIPWNRVAAEPGRGTYCLYHGNLSVSENEKAAEWLLEEVFNDLNIPFVIAGANPSPALQTLAHKSSSTCIVVNPAENEMNDLIRKAHINITPSFNRTGVKLKLLNALFNGRYCIANSNAVSGSELYGCYEVADTISAMKERVQTMFEKSFTEKDISAKEIIIRKIYNNKETADLLISSIY